MICKPLYIAKPEEGVRKLVKIASKSVRTNLSVEQTFEYCQTLWQIAEDARTQNDEEYEYVNKWAMNNTIVNLKMKLENTNQGIENHVCIGRFGPTMDRLEVLRKSLDKRYKEKIERPTTGQTRPDVLPPISLTPRAPCERETCKNLQQLYHDLIKQNQEICKDKNDALEMMRQRNGMRRKTKPDHPSNNRINQLEKEKKDHLLTIQALQATIANQQRQIDSAIGNDESKKFKDLVEKQGERIEELEKEVNNKQRRMEIYARENAEKDKRILSCEHILKDLTEGQKRQSQQSEKRITELQKLLREENRAFTDCEKRLFDASRALAVFRNQAQKEDNIHLKTIRNRDESIKILKKRINKLEFDLDCRNEHGANEDVHELLEKLQRLEAIEEKLLCQICFDDYNDKEHYSATLSTCGHVFGKTCIAEALRSQQRCPICNKNATARNILRIFLV
ncbi:Oidioi.mRNA.OKI2018_I69.chr2.g8195.t1.cds [Oikopleura dioica]|uniref:Oidioi.mRNA.OKI2018_I69.chr2.g8195.t1.cds n=1 Tax=Oikopleura dioica TaxID=34765 RepID=A0ABN7TES8_OIKDI|nr:Oidioi.mRNA.OKI2018_I69.chr2.g8195.t1.cds [Oikopleura dioica]